MPPVETRNCRRPWAALPGVFLLFLKKSGTMNDRVYPESIVHCPFTAQELDKHAVLIENDYSYKHPTWDRQIRVERILAHMLDNIRRDGPTGDRGAELDRLRAAMVIRLDYLFTRGEDFPERITEGVLKEAEVWFSRQPK